MKSNNGFNPRCLRQHTVRCWPLRLLAHALLLGGYEDLVRLLGPRARQ